MKENSIMTKLIRPTLGFAQGCIIYYLLFHTRFDLVYILVAAFVLTFPLLSLQLKLPARNSLYFALTILIPITVIYGLAGFSLAKQLVLSQSYTKEWLTIYLLSLQCAISGFIVFVFYCTALHERRLVFPYSTLFHEAWQVLLKLLFGVFLVQLTWGLCFLAAHLFHLLAIQFVLNIVQSKAFHYIMLPCFFGMAMTVLEEYDDVLTKMRNILLAFCKFLYPLFVVMSLSFLLVIPFSSKKFADIWMVSPLMSLINIFLYNGIFQAGLIQPPYSRWFRKIIYVTMLLLVIYALYVLQFPWEVIHNYGFKTYAFLLEIFIIILAGYQLNYCLAIFFSKTPWMSLVKCSNTIMALFVAILYLALALPWINLNQIAANIERERIQNHQVTTDKNIGDIYQ